MKIKKAVHWMRQNGFDLASVLTALKPFGSDSELKKMFGRVSKPNIREAAMESKSQVIQLARKGLSSNEIRKRIGNKLSRQQVAAVKAHVTMESYDKSPVTISDLDHERIKDLLKKGLTSAEIRNRLNGKYNHQQIAGIKAAMTRRVCRRHRGKIS